MSRDLKLLERHFRHWRQEGLVTTELESALRKSSGELEQRSTSSVVRTALAGLGGGLLLPRGDGTFGLLAALSVGIGGRPTPRGRAPDAGHTSSGSSKVTLRGRPPPCAGPSGSVAP